jgi:hypothetical protein
MASHGSDRGRGIRKHASTQTRQGNVTTTICHAPLQKVKNNFHKVKIASQKLKITPQKVKVTLQKMTDLV